MRYRDTREGRGRGGRGRGREMIDTSEGEEGKRKGGHEGHAEGTRKGCDKREV